MATDRLPRFWKDRKGAYLVLLALLAAAFAVGQPYQTVAFTDRSEGAPGGNLSEPINTSRSTQEKAGMLTLSCSAPGNCLTLPTPQTKVTSWDHDPTPVHGFCLYGAGVGDEECPGTGDPTSRCLCRTDWEIGSWVRVYAGATTAQTGSASVQSSVIPFLGKSALTAIGSEAGTTSAHFGFVGQTAIAGSAAQKAGVVGTTTQPEAHGVLGCVNDIPAGDACMSDFDAANSAAWAGYFTGGNFLSTGRTIIDDQDPLVTPTLSDNYPSGVYSASAQQFATDKNGVVLYEGVDSWLRIQEAGVVGQEVASLDFRYDDALIQAPLSINETSGFLTRAGGTILIENGKEICLYGSGFPDCRSIWPTGADDVWQEGAQPSRVYPIDLQASKDLVFGCVLNPDTLVMDCTDPALKVDLSLDRTRAKLIGNGAGYAQNELCLDDGLDCLP